MTQIIFCYFSNPKKIGEISEIIVIRVLIGEGIWKPNPYGIVRIFLYFVSLWDVGENPITSRSLNRLNE